MLLLVDSVLHRQWLGGCKQRLGALCIAVVLKYLLHKEIGCHSMRANAPCSLLQLARLLAFFLFWIYTASENVCSL